MEGPTITGARVLAMLERKDSAMFEANSTVETYACW